MFTEFDPITDRSFTRNEGDIWQESNGPDSLGWFTSRDNRKVPIIMEDWVWRWTWCWQHHVAGQKEMVQAAVASGDLDRQNPRARENFRALLKTLEARAKAR